MEEMVIYSIITALILIGEAVKVIGLGLGLGIITALILIGEAVKVIICIHKNNESGDSSNSGSFSSNSNSG